MQFVHPLILAGLAVASIPIIIHLLNKRRFRIVDWAAMEFLLASQKKNYRRLRIEELLLLILRTLLIAIIVFAVARPILSSGRITSFLAGVRKCVVVLIDRSFSMDYHRGATTPFSRAKDTCASIVKGLRPGDTVTIIPFTRTASPLFSEPTPEHRLALSETEKLRVSHDTSKVFSALLKAYEIVRSSPQPRKLLYLISDFQRVSFDKESLKKSDTLEKIQELSRLAELIFVDVGFNDADNIALSPPGTESRAAIIGSTLSITGTVRNYSTAPAEVRVDLLLDGAGQGTSNARVQSFQDATVSFLCTIPSEGIHRVELKTESDALSVDDRSYLSLVVRRAFNVLLVDGEPGTESIDSEVFYLKQALMPEGGEGVSLARVRAVTSDSVADADFENFDVVALANVPSIESEAFSRLSQYIRDGGAVLIFLGDRIERDFYNTSLASLAGCELEEISHEPSSVSVRDYSHPAFRLFRGLRLTRIESAKFRARWLLKPIEGKVLIEFSKGEPALVEHNFGKGKAFLFASSADTEWNDFPTRPAYPAFLNELLRYCARDLSRRFNLSVGEALVALLPPEYFARKVELRMPDGRTVPLSPIPERKNVLCGYDSLPLAGFYTLRSEGLEQHYAVNLPSEESDLRRLRPSELAKFLPRVKFSYRRALLRASRGVQSTPRSELARTLLYCLMGLAMLELFLAQKFTR